MRPFLPFASALALASSTALANPRPSPFTYGADTLAAGESEVEQFVDYVPTRAIATGGERSGAPVWYGATQLQTELEHGITDRLELGLYLTWVPSAGEAYQNAPRLFTGNGLKQRLRFRLADAGAWPVDVALYGEVVENQREIELEAKLILDRRFGPFRAMANAQVERELYFDGVKEWVLQPSAALVWQPSPSIQPGVEWWMRGEWPDGQTGPRGFDQGPHHYVGPTLLASFGRVWWSTGVYARVDRMAHTMKPGESMGAVWARTVVGIEL